MAKKSKDTAEETTPEVEIQEVSVKSEVVESLEAVEVKELPTVLKTLPDDVQINGNQVVRGKNTFYF